MIDCHTHTKLSHDGNYSAKEMVAQAKKLGLTYYAITDHMDRDYIEFSPSFYQIDLDTLYKTVFEVKEQKGMYVAFGVECGYSKSAQSRYIEELPNYPFDIILNSLHTLDGIDIYFKDYFDNKTQREAYGSYFRGVLASVNASYPYDVITHLGYVIRNAPYSPKTVIYSEYADYLDEILKRIIEKGKCLEINANITCERCGFYPNKDIINRYKELGGEMLSYGSDAHRIERIALNYDAIAKVVKSLGFKYYTVFKNRKPSFVEI